MAVFHPASDEPIQAEAESQSDANSQSHAHPRRGKHDLQHIPFLRTQSHSDAEFVSSLDNRIGNDAVEANRCQHERKDRKSSEKDGN